MTFQTTNKSLSVPDDGQDDWDDEIQSCFVDIDTYLKGIGETSISKAQADLESLSVGSSVNIADSGNLVIGTDGDLSIVYSPTSNVSKVTDTQSGDVLFTLPHGTSSGPIVSDRNITMKDGPVASQSYADATASTTANNVTNESEITPTSVAIDTPSLSLDTQAVQLRLDNYVVPVAEGLGVNDAIDPSTTSTPISDAIAKIAAVGQQANIAGSIPNKGGTVLLPPGTVQEGAPITDIGGITIQGAGYYGSTIEFTDLTADGFHIDGQSTGAFSYIDNIQIHGSDRDTRTNGSAIHYVNPNGGACTHQNIGQIILAGWGGPDPVIWGDGIGPYGSHWRDIYFDPYQNAGVPVMMNHAGNLALHIDRLDVNSIDDVYPVQFLDSKMGGYIGEMNINSDNTKALFHRTGFVSTDSLYINWINVEPNNPVTVTQPLLRLGGWGPCIINNITTHNITMDSTPIVQLESDDNGRGPSRKQIGRINGHDTTYPVIKATQQQSAGPSWYWGSSTDMSDPFGDTIIPMMDLDWTA